jgi:hypothetical protein
LYKKTEDEFVFLLIEVYNEISWRYFTRNSITMTFWKEAKLVINIWKASIQGISEVSGANEIVKEETLENKI